LQYIGYFSLKNMIYWKISLGIGDVFGMRAIVAAYLHGRDSTPEVATSLNQTSG
jgi:hypothetical protein